VHAEANAIIAASREEMLGATLFLAGEDARTGQLISDGTCCNMCRRLIINAGIEKVIIRNTPDEYTIVDVEDWVKEDDVLPDEMTSSYK
ncbi:MAG: cytidine deaminase, partial [Clostridia bacterium]|nr:cytidine deaminase [Clostridia bacterium]